MDNAYQIVRLDIILLIVFAPSRLKMKHHVPMDCIY